MIELREPRIYAAARHSTGAGAIIGAAPGVRPVRLALLGLGNVGQAVVRLLADETDRLRATGALPRLVAALLRDPRRPRACRLPDGCVVTADPTALLAQRPDVVIDVLPDAASAAPIVAEALRRGISVVSANKALIAAHGAALAEIADRHGAALQYEAAVIAGVPFVETLRRRPLARRATRLCGILNGTSNYVLSEVERGSGFDEALESTVRLGYAEPDATRDLSGADAADKLVILARLLGLGELQPAGIERSGVDSLDPADFVAARAVGGVIRPLAFAAAADVGIETFVGPGWLPAEHALARVRNADNGLLLDGPGGRLLFAGPGAGPEATAATLIDDALDLLRAPHDGGVAAAAPSQPGAAPLTGWLLRVGLPTDAPSWSDLCDLLAAYGVWPLRTHVLRGAVEERRYLLTTPCRRADIEAAGAHLEALGYEATALRALEATDDAA